MKDFKYNPDLYGNNNNLDYFSKVIDENKLSHAYTIVGPTLSGKNTLVFNIIEKILNKENLSPKLFERILNGTCPDVRIIDLDDGKQSIGIDQIRDGLKDIYLTPFELTFKVYIIRNADKMTVQAQNSLLKSIEEPNNNVYFFLLVKNSSFLLQTINSRTQKINVQLFTQEEIENLLDKNVLYSNYSNEQKKFSARFAQGSFGKAIELLDENTKEFSIYKNVKKILLNLSQKSNVYNLFQYSRDMEQLIYPYKKEKSELRSTYNLILSYFLLGFRDILSIKMSNINDLIFFDYEEIKTHVQKLKYNDIQECINNISNQQINSKINCS